MNRFTTTLLAAACALTAAAGAAQGANFSQHEYDALKEDIKAGFKAERRACGQQSGNARKVCLERARGGERVALAQLQLNYTGLAGDEAALHRAEYRAQYGIEKQRCAELAGSQKEICLQTARTEYDKARADARMARRISQAVADDTRARLKADYELAREKCEALSGRDAREACIASAKASYNEGW